MCVIHTIGHLDSHILSHLRPEEEEEERVKRREGTPAPLLLLLPFTPPRSQAR